MFRLIQFALLFTAASAFTASKPAFVRQVSGMFSPNAREERYGKDSVVNYAIVKNTISLSTVACYFLACHRLSNRSSPHYF
jgi:hypothetical protein